MMDIEFLLLLQNFRETIGGVFDGVMLEITELAGALPTFLLLAGIYWCIDKKLGQRMGMNVALACTLSQFLKAVCKVERPWVRDERIHPVEAAIPAAGGYSFPSGHTARAVATWGVAGAGTVQSGKKSGEKEKVFLGVLSWGLTFLILFSRNYLGVHTPQDVLAALMIGVVIMFVVDKVLRWGEEQGRDIWICIAGCVLCFLPMLRVGCMPNAGAGMGFFIGWLVEKRFVRFETTGTGFRKWLRFLCGGAVVAFLQLTVSRVLSLVMAAKYAGFFAGFLLMFFIMAVYPFLFQYVEKQQVQRKVTVIGAGIVVAVLIAIGLFSKQSVQSAPAENVAEESAEPETEAGQETDVQSIKIIGHRGYPSVFPENTLASFAGALDIGVDYIETDVQMTKDGELVLFHDDTITRITGQEGMISDYTYEELAQMDAGSWFSPEYTGERIPTLQEFLNLIKDSDVKVYLELKDIGEVEGFEEKVLEAVCGQDMLERCVFASFRYEYLAHIKELDEAAEILYNTTSAKTSIPEEFPAEYYGLYAETVTESAVEAIHRAGKQAFVWTANTPEQIKNLQAMCVDGIVTNKPGLAKVVVHPEYAVLTERFEASITMPGLYERNLPEECSDMVVQGLTQAGGYLVISAYSSSGQYDSMLYITDLNGKLQKTVKLGFAAHTGGIAYDEEHELLWVTAAEGAVYGISWPLLMSGAYQGEIQTSFDAGLVNHNQAKVASFLTLYEGKLYVGSYVDGANGQLNCYDIADIANPTLLSQVAIPQRIQGVTFRKDATAGKTDMYLSQGYQMEDACFMRFCYDEQTTVYEVPEESWTLPEGAEQILMTAKGLYILFESSARPYRETARIVNDQIYVLRM